MLNRTFTQLATIVLSTLLLSALMLVPAFAQVKPGDLINADSAAKVKNIVSPGVYYKVAHGMSMKIVPTQRIDWPPPYRDASEKYSGQVHLSSDHRSVLGYVA